MLLERVFMATAMALVAAGIAATFMGVGVILYHAYQVVPGPLRGMGLLVFAAAVVGALVGYRSVGKGY